MQNSSSKHIKAIAELSSSIHALNSVEDIAWALTQEIIKYLDFEDCVVYTLDHKNKMLTQVAAYGPKIKARREIKNSIQIKLGEHIVGHVAKTGETAVVHDTSVDNRYLVDDKRRFSELTVPIKVGDLVIGVIDSEHSEKNFFTQLDIDTVSAMANMISMQLQKGLESKRKTLQIEELEKLISLMLNHSNSAVLFEGLDDKIIMANQAYCDCLNTEKTPDELVGTSIFELADDFASIFEDKETFLNRVQKLKANNKPVLNEELKIGRDQYFSRDFVPVNFKGEIIGYLWQYNDITEKVRALQKKENALQLEKRLNKVNKNLVSIASHEFRTPLTSIKSTVDLLVSNADKFDKDGIINRLKRVSRATDNMSVLLDDIMELGKLENFKNEKQIPEWISESDIIQMAEEIVGDYMPGRDVQIRQKERCNLRCKISKNKLYLIIKNLLSNADKYSEAPAPIIVDLNQTKDHAKITVKDLGIGIPEEQLPSIFDPFERGTNTDNKKGTGLGLFISKRAAEILGGTLTIKSSVNKGTSVTLTIPV